MLSSPNYLEDMLNELTRSMQKHIHANLTYYLSIEHLSLDLLRLILKRYAQIVPYVIFIPKEEEFI